MRKPQGILNTSDHRKHSHCDLSTMLMNTLFILTIFQMRELNPSKSWLIGKDSDAGRDWGQEEKGTTEDEMAGWHHWLDGCESGWTPGVGDGQRGLACCDSWGRKESDMTERLIWSDLMVLWHLKQIGKVKKLNKWVPHKQPQILKKKSFWSVVLFYAKYNKPFLDQAVMCNKKWI